MSKPRFLPGHLNVPTNTARNLNGDDTIWSCCGNRVEVGHRADCERHPPASEDIEEMLAEWDSAACDFFSEDTRGRSLEEYRKAGERFAAAGDAISALVSQLRSQLERTREENERLRGHK